MDEKELKTFLDAEFAAFKETLPNFINKEGMEKAFSEFKTEIEKKDVNQVSKEQFEKLEEAMKLQGAEIAAFKLQTTDKKKTFLAELKEQFEANKTAIESTIKGGGNFRFTLKETAAVSVASSDFSAGSFQGFREAVVDGTQPNEFQPLTLIQTMNGGKGSNPLSWLERSVKSGAAAGIAEGAESPSINYEWTEAEKNSRIISALTVVSKRVVNNYPMLQQEVTGELLIALQNELNRQIINGTDSATEIKGINTYATTLDTTDYAVSIVGANYWDVLLLAWRQSRKAYKGSRPNAVLVSIGTGVDMDLTKDKNNNYVFPAFMINQEKSLKGVTIIESDDVADGEFLIGDFTKCLFNFVEPLVIEIGYMDDQFGKRQFSILAEVCGMQRVKSQFAGSFVKGIFSAAIAAIDKPDVIN